MKLSTVSEVSLRDDHVGVEEYELSDFALIKTAAPIHQYRP